MKKLLIFMLVLGMGMSLVFSAGDVESKKEDKTLVLKVGLVESLENPIGKMGLEFKRIVEEESKGKIKVDVFPSMQLGDPREMVEATQLGNQEIAVVSHAWVSSFVPQMSILSFPYLFKDEATAYKLVDGEIGNELIEYSKSKGFQVLGFPAVGFRQLTNSTRPINKLEDFRGLKIRLQGDPVHIATYKALGANPVSMNFSELYSAMQQKVVDGQENTTTNIYLNKFNEVQKYFSYTNTLYDCWVILMSKNIYDSLSEDLQDVLLKAARKSIELQRKLVEQADADYANELLKSIPMNRIDPKEMDRIVEKARTVYTQFDNEIGKELVQKVMNAVK